MQLLNQKKMRSIRIPKDINYYINNSLSKEEMCLKAAEAYKNLNTQDPQISIVMPAYNESHNIVPTLWSLCANNTKLGVEIIVSNNNSSDDTGALASACGVTCIFEGKQGITFARNAGLEVARGKYIVNADADTIYPKDWIEEMVRPLIQDENTAITYGRFAFIPIGSTGRFTYFFYEYLAELSRWYNKKVKDEAVNVYGFNSAFRKEQGLQVEGFNHPPGTNEDGWLAVKLREKGFGVPHYVTAIKAMVWTTDRRIQIDGGLFKGTIKRAKRLLNLG
ncbi:glycosyltransferase family 2 protein [Pedobacter frigoris]|uniref:Glycosyltransferase family 2 protein n=1 Tax=Pedobacter frigoris TaxID=2571272 RepID=A0A4U1CQZ8_9SPHI|nr:glycosyltransferase family 2 protein [Pedobacter frigoris]TKC09330.1 glycosyltransferase family 2 protein [Pedobacter frigoris]